jgi:DNA-binding GntR family transcriptional regulator
MTKKDGSTTETVREASTRSDTVYQLIRRAILEQALNPGTRLPEDRVGEQFGVSRTIVRRH